MDSRLRGNDDTDANQSCIGALSPARLLACWPLFALLASVAHAQSASPLRFEIREGRVQNAFYQHGPVAAHLLLSDGIQPRVLVAFPAGNSGVGLWFEKAQQPVRWTLNRVDGVSRADVRGRMLHGIIAEVSVDGPLVVRDAVLSSVRVLRDYQIESSYPPEVKSIAKVTGNAVEWSRSRLDGAAGYSLSIEVREGEVRGGNGVHLSLAPTNSAKEIRMRITALTGETPLTPFDSTRLFNANVGDDLRSRQVLSFLSYEEKFLAGSWRFDTYFGRDTLMSLRLLMPALQPEVIEHGIASVLQRLAPNGEVAHEEDIGEFAVLRHRKQRDTSSDSPIYDYKMIDDDFMLAPLAAAYLIEDPNGRARAERFLSSQLPNGDRVGAALARNFVWATQSAQAFSRAPKASNFISLKPGVSVGEWRDSEDGLAGGRYPYDVNAVLVPASMSAIAQFVRSGLIKPYLSNEQSKTLSSADSSARVWSREAPKLFRVRLNEVDARRQISTYAADIGVSAAAALDSLPKGDVVVNAIALDAQSRPIPVLHSDGGFALLLQDLPVTDLEQIVDSALRPFPAGLLTDAGLLVANPVFAEPAQQRKFDRAAYHGTVVWSWQQAMFAAGLQRQLERRDLPATTVTQLRDARERLWSAIRKTRELRSSELWSWQFVDGHYEPAPFGQSSGDADESNAAQLWSTVYLAISPPK